MARHVRVNDMVYVRTGKDAGRVARVLRVLPRQGRVLVEGVNVVTRHMRPSQSNPQGGVITKEMPVAISNVQPVVEGKPTRVRFRTEPDGSKHRVAAVDGTKLGRPLKEVKT